MKRILALTFVLLLAVGLVPLAAQTSVTTTTLSAAVTATSNRLTVASATGFVADTTWVYVDREVMKVTGVSGTSITVLRGASGTRVDAHLTGSVVYVGPFSIFRASDPSGSCTSTAQLYTPTINPETGGIWECSSTANLWFDWRKVVTVQCHANLVADMVDQQCFIADKSYAVVKVYEIHRVAESAGTLTLIPKKTTGTTAIASGTALTAAAIDMVGAGAVAETLKTPALSATPTALQIVAGNRLGLDFTDDTAGELAGVLVTFVLWPR